MTYVTEVQEDRPASGQWHCGPNAAWVTVTHLPTMISARAFDDSHHRARQAAKACCEMMVEQSRLLKCQFPDRLTTPDTIARLTAEPAGEDVERVAKAIAHATSLQSDSGVYPKWSDFRDEARAAIAALHRAEDTERVVVPREPTEAMLEAAACRDGPHLTALGDHEDVADVWSAMLAAAPKHPTDDLRRAREAEDFLDQLRRVNTERYEAWVGDGQDAGILFDAAELGGEVGELLNVVKKLEREERGWRGSRAVPEDFADECADVLICLDKLARRKGVDLAAATIAKFNATSEKVGLPQRLAAFSTVSKKGS